jgi:hypothetical protein
MISIKTISTYLFYIYFIDIIIYILKSMSWSSGIFRIVGQVIVDPSMGLSSLCEVVPQVPILINNPRVVDK